MEKTIPKDIDYSDIPSTNEAFWAKAEIHLRKKKFDYYCALKVILGMIFNIFKN